jgi:hypothetical protein
MKIHILRAVFPNRVSIHAVLNAVKAVVQKVCIHSRSHGIGKNTLHQAYVCAL